MTNKSMLLKAAVLMLLSINCVHAQTIFSNIITDATPDSRYTVHEPHADGPQTITDTVTGLMWRRCSMGKSGTTCSVSTASTHTWIDALGLAASANMASTAGYSDWRLPNIKELRSIVAYDRINPSINSDAFPNTAIAYYWSSSPNANESDRAWIIGFENGAIAFDDRPNKHSVRLVRSGQ